MLDDDFETEAQRFNASRPLIPVTSKYQASRPSLGLGKKLKVLLLIAIDME